MPYHWFQPRPPARPIVALPFVLGGTTLIIVITGVVGMQVSNLPAQGQAILAIVGYGCLIMLFIQALISGIFISHWKPRAERTVSFYVTGIFGFLLVLWLGLGIVLLMFNPFAPPWFSLYGPLLIGVGLGVVLSLPYVIVQLRQRRRGISAGRDTATAPLADPAIQIDSFSGKPMIAGTSITVQQILEQLRDGKTTANILSDNPQLTAAHIAATLDYAAHAMDKPTTT